MAITTISADDARRTVEQSDHSRKLIAAHAGINTSTLSLWMHGKRKLSDETIRRVHDAAVSPDVQERPPRRRSKRRTFHDLKQAMFTETLREKARCLLTTGKGVALAEHAEVRLDHLNDWAHGRVVVLPGPVQRLTAAIATLEEAKR